MTACIDAEKKIDKTPKSSGNRKFRHGYSYEMVQRTRALSSCKGLLKESRKHDKRSAVGMYKLLAEKYTGLFSLPRCPNTNSPPNQWHTWSKQVEEAIYQLRRSLHHSNVLDMRRKSSEHAEKIEKARLTSGESRNFFQYITPSSYTPPATEYFSDGRWVNTPKGIMSLEESHLEKHTKWYVRARPYISQ